MKFSPRFLDQLRSRLTLSEIVGQRVKLSKKGREFQGLCPFHTEKTPSFTVNDDKEFYHCFGCGAHGDAVRFLVDTQNFSFPEAVKELCEKAGVPLPVDDDYAESQPVNQDLFTVMDDACAWFQSQLFSSSATEAQLYLEGRGFGPAHVKEFQLGYAPSLRQGLKQVLLAKGYKEDLLVEAGLLIRPDEGGETYDRFRSRIMFPIHNLKGQIVAFGGRILGDGQPKYLNSPETPLFSKGHLLYNYHHAKKALAKGVPPLVVEGYTDVLSLRKSGIEGAVAPMGTALTEEQIALLWRLSPEPILCFDGDGAGQKAAIRGALRVLPLLKPGYTLNFLYLPKGEDPDSYVRTRGKTGFQSLLQQKISLVDVLWMSLTQSKNLNAPEQKALVLKEIETLTLQIDDPATRSTFKSALKDKYYALRSSGIIRKATKLSAPEKFIDKIGKSLLVMTLHHPHILNEFSEEFAGIDFNHPQMTLIQQDMLNFMVENGSEDSSILHHYLEERGHHMDDLLTPLPGQYSTRDGINEEWKQLYGQHQTQLLHEEMKQLQKSLANDMSEKAWMRMTELRKRLDAIGAE